MERLSHAQRVVVVVATGLGLWVAGRYLVQLHSFPGFHFGSASSASYLVTASKGNLTPSTGFPPLARLIIWLVLLGLWALVALKVLEQPADSHIGADLNDE